MRTLAALLALTAACNGGVSGATPSEIVVEIDAEPSVREEAASLHFVVEGTTGIDDLKGKVTRLDEVLKPARFPKRIAIVPLKGDDARAFVLTVTALDRERQFVAEGRIISGYAPNEVRYAKILLEDACIGVTCDVLQTCAGSTCADAKVNASVLSGDSARPTVLAGDIDGGIDGGGAAETGIASAGDRCASAGSRACTGQDSKLPLVCNGGAWQAAEPCSDTERCDTSEGASLGECRPIAAECSGHQPGESFCAGEVIRKCEDLLGYTDTTCGNHETCGTHQGTPQCICKSGFEGTLSCVDINECETENGACDPLTTCTNTVGAHKCSACPAGYTGKGETGCVPTLTGLTALSLSSGTLTPALASDVAAYRATVGLTTETITLTPTAPPGASITINGVAVPSGLGWKSPTLSLGNNTITIVVTQAGRPTRKSMLVLTRGRQEAYLKAGNTSYNGQFGYKIATSGDTVAVAELFDASAATGIDGDQSDDSALQSGAVYVFVRSGTAWSQQAYIKASNTEAVDQFGSSIALSGDTLVVGALGEDSAATGVNGNQADNSAGSSGAAYVFTRSGSTWTQQAYLKASNAGASDQFGRSVAISDDTLVVGALGESSAATGVNGNQADNSASNSGAAFVFVRNGSTWTQQAYLKASNTEADDRFGSAVSLSADTVVVGAASESSSARGINGNQSDNGAAVSGAAYVFVRGGVTWTQQAYLKASNADANDQFGMAVAISGDTIAVGAFGEDSAAVGIDGDESDNTGTGSGAVYVFRRSANAWTQQAYLKASNTGANDRFGICIALSGDTLAAGAPGESSAGVGFGANQANNNMPSSGAVYVFARHAGAWSQQAYVKASNTGLADSFGASLSLSSDALAIGAQNEASAATGIDGDQSDDSVVGSGAAYVFR